MAYKPDEVDEIKKAIVKSLKKGATRESAAGAAGVCKQTLYDWMAKDEDFKNKVDAACRHAVETVENALFMNATVPDQNGKINTTAQIFFLKNRAYETWRDSHESKVEHVGGVKIVFSDSPAPDQEGE